LIHDDLALEELCNVHEECLFAESIRGDDYVMRRQPLAQNIKDQSFSNMLSGEGVLGPQERGIQIELIDASPMERTCLTDHARIIAKVTSMKDGSKWFSLEEEEYSTGTVIGIDESDVERLRCTQADEVCVTYFERVH